MTKLLKKLDFTGQPIFIGIDVHLKSWNISVYLQQQYLTSFNQPPTTLALQTFLQNSYPNASYKCAYESGFCGHWIQRELLSLGIECIVINAADVPQTDKTAKNKTDTNDSKRIAQALQAGFLQPIYIPDEEVEADRQLVRCNEKFTNDLTRVKNRIKGMLYHLGIKLPEYFSNSNWSNLFIKWLKELELKNPSAKRAIQHQLTMAENIRIQKLAVLKDIRALLKKDRYSATAKYLLTVPGIGTVTTATLLTEIDNMKRFSNFEQLNSYIGYYPSQFSSGENIHQGNIIGRQHKRLRSLIIEAAWTAIRTDPAMTMVYNQFKLKVGGKRAIIKVARKLLSRIRHVWLNQVEYEKGVIR
ncbi:MAG: IS110 family transposase [Bacteroidetes bacterium CG18_big_fil_WC_8_21_14_2_50_41_14]|nr:MAG: IS110 family transposase [Bacteroidetes bacterium CG18_big_fil_WC_8_21_14_2_50_41_14]PJB58131.1 MAG: IS110 family transposase [Bacteroidetes bacterium CG_4_9_14_3_um_filter_41_19]